MPATTSTGRRLWHQKVDPLLNQLRLASNRYRVPSSNVSIDEAMIQQTGRSADTYKLPRKPIPQGFKFHCLADHGYVYDFHPTSNKSGADPLHEPEDDTSSSLSETSKVVLDLAKRLPYKQLAFNISLDNYYTSIPLLAALRTAGIGGCGTARTSSKNFPPELAVPKTAVIDYHRKAGIIIDKVATAVWMDNRPVPIMTTVHKLKGRNSEIPRWRKRPGPKSSNAAGIRKARVFTEDEWQKLLDIPCCIDNYNKHMGGVDIADQYRSYYSTHLTSWRTWYSLFHWGVDTSLTNSFIIYNDIPDVVARQHKEFLMEVAWEFMMCADRGSRTKGLALEATTDNSSPTNFYLTKNRGLPRPEQHGMHMPVHLEGCNECILCRWRSRSEEGVRTPNTTKTRWKCTTCDHPLCLNDKRNCFKEYHELVD